MRIDVIKKYCNSEKKTIPSSKSKFGDRKQDVNSDEKRDKQI